MGGLLCFKFRGQLLHPFPELVEPIDNQIVGADFSFVFIHEGLVLGCQPPYRLPAELLLKVNRFLGLLDACS
jgi:hypothetical protein